jgi:hypothetical protein
LRHDITLLDLLEMLLLLSELLLLLLLLLLFEELPLEIG